MHRIAPVFALLLCIAAVAVDGRASTPTKEEAALRAVDVAWSEAAGRKDLDGVVSYMAEDGETLAPNEPAARGAAAIRASWSGLLGLPNLQLKWEPVTVIVAKSGELGTTRGTYTMSFTGPDGSTVTDRGKYVEVWEKINGAWKCVVDAYSSDLPAAK